MNTPEYVDAKSGGPGRGSEFVVRLPIAVRSIAKLSAASLLSSTTRMRRSEIDLALWVTSSTPRTTAKRPWQKASGHDVQTASDGRTAISVALDFEPNAVLMDNSMPGMSGLEVAKQMRLEPKLKDAILIALTGHGDEADRQRSFEAGFDHHLVKPADIRVIRELLKTVR